MRKVSVLVVAMFGWRYAVIATAQSEQAVPARLISAIRYEIRFEHTFRGRGDGRMSSCISPEWDTLPPDHHRNTGWEYRSLPGFHSAIYLLNVNDSQSRARSHAIAQLSFLAKLGFFRETNGYVATPSGKQLAKEFRLTPAGLASIYPMEAPAPCFLIGVRDISEVIAIQPANTSDSRAEQFTVLIRTQVQNTPPWAQSREAQALFPELRELTSPRTEAVTAWKYGDTWVTGLRQQAIERFLSTDQQALRAHIAQWNREYAFPSDPTATLNEVKRGQMTDDLSGKSIESAACFPLRLVAGGDARSTRSRSVFAFYDIEPSARAPTGMAHTVGQLNILSALARTGAAIVEPIEGAAASGASAKRGVAFRIDVNARKFVEMNCLPLGAVSVDALASFQVQPEHVKLFVHARLKDVPRITRDAAEGIPALQTILNEGAVFEAFLLYRGEDGLSDKNTRWHLSGIKLAAPNMLFYDFPEAVSSLLPQTANAAGEAISAELRYRTPKAVAFHPE